LYLTALIQYQPDVQKIRISFSSKIYKWTRRLDESNIIVSVLQPMFPERPSFLNNKKRKHENSIKKEKKWIENGMTFSRTYHNKYSH